MNKSLKQALNKEWISINRLSNKKKITKILTVKRDQPSLLSSNFTQTQSLYIMKYNIKLKMITTMTQTLVEIFRNGR